MQNRRETLKQSLAVAGLLGATGLFPQFAHAAFNKAAFDAKSVADAVKLFRTASEQEGKKIFGLMVTDAQERLVGMLSMYDILLFIRPKHAALWGEIEDLRREEVFDELLDRVKAIRVEDPEDLASAFEKARALMAEYKVPVVVEVILERVTNISMGTELDNVTEFEELAARGADAPTAITALLD